ncbi:MAG TPA: diadenylate cyclase CdaA [Candidatus Gracilibacteria bacterium]|nr:diadenylate cyclase CdaA [Candidatus Gracilibacteria bacterium]
MDILSRVLADFILLIGRQAQTFWDNLALLNFSLPQIFLDIVLVAIIFYFIFSLLQGSRALHMLIGIGVLAILFILSKALQLVALGWLLDKFLTVFLIAIPIIFQRELRMGLERIGNTKIFLNQRARQIDRMILNIVDACEILAKEKTGALIVVQGTVPLKEFVDTGVMLDAAVSRELLQSIFNVKSPLHDGAVIIEENKIIAASCILPHSFETNHSGLGTRHKAALGLSENTDASIVVVSEERGTISFAREGKMERHITAGELQSLLLRALQPARRNGKELKPSHAINRKNKRP